MRSSCSSNLINKEVIDIDNTTTQNQRSESETGPIKQNTSAINLPDKDTYTILLSTPRSIDDIVQSLVSTSVLSNRDLQGITRLLRYYPGINHAELIDQILGRILAHIRGYAPDKVRNPTAFFKELATKSKKGFFNLDTFGQAVSEAGAQTQNQKYPGHRIRSGVLKMIDYWALSTVIQGVGSAHTQNHKPHGVGSALTTKRQIRNKERSAACKIKMA